MQTSARSRFRPSPLLFAAFALLLVPPARAAEAPGAAPFPFRLGPQDAVLGISSAALLAWGQVRYFDMEPARPSELDPDDLPALDRWAAGNYSEPAMWASDALLFPALAAPMALSAWDARARGRWSDLAVEAAIYAEALTLSSALNLLTRSLRVHPRPLAYDSDSPDSEKRKGEASGSFYSGHANGAFLAAAYVGYTYPLRHPEFEHAGWLRAGAFGYAAVVAGLRVAAGKHFPSDILVGSAAGTLFGWLFPRLHLRTPAQSGASAEPRPRLGLRMIPLEDGVLARLSCGF